MHDLRDLLRRPLPTRCFAGALLLSPSFGCVMGEGSLGDYTETDTSTGPGTGRDTDDSSSGSGGEGPACTEDCDPVFAVSHFRGPNFAAEGIARLSPSTCVGPSCPASVSPVSPLDGTAIEECMDTEAAQSSPVGPEEYCRIAPHYLANRIEFGFTTPVDRSSFEELRPRIDKFPIDGLTTEPYRWYPDVATLRGPGTALRGDYHTDGDQRTWITNVIHETCAERLTALGVPWTPETLEEQCVGTWDDDGVLRPLKMAPSMVFSSYEGILSHHDGISCDTPEADPDTCCSPCDRALGPQVARYGVDGAGTRRNANLGTAIACDPEGDALVECRDLVLAVERDPGFEYTYAWNGAEQSWPLPRYDKLRETHPEDRPAGLEDGVACIDANDCEDGQDCIGTNAAGDACHAGADCVARSCRAEWFGDCQATEGGSAFCVDRRFSARGAGACLAATADFAHGSEGDRLSQCDTNADGLATAMECCDPALGGAAGCDPFYQPNLAEVARYDRDPAQPAAAACVCEEGPSAECADVVDAWCEAPLGSESGPYPSSPAGAYAVPTVTRPGGVRWFEDLELFRFHTANEGNVSRAITEECAAFEQLIGDRNPADGWLTNRRGGEPAELLEDHDLALCSGSSYRFVLAESGAEHHVRSAAGETLDGRSEHVLETPQFRISPVAPRPSPNSEEFTSCSSYWVSLSNAYDPSETNLRKLEVHEGAPDGLRVAGGPDCDPQASPAEIAMGAIPCLSIDYVGTSDSLIFLVDESIHGQVFQPGTTYYVVLPGLADIGQMADAEAYAAAFHDVCGMPLIVGDTTEELALTELSFTVEAGC